MKNFAPMFPARIAEPCYSLHSYEVRTLRPANTAGYCAPLPRLKLMRANSSRMLAATTLGEPPSRPLATGGSSVRGLTSQHPVSFGRVRQQYRQPSTNTQPTTDEGEPTYFAGRPKVDSECAYVRLMAKRVHQRRKSGPKWRIHPRLVLRVQRCGGARNYHKPCKGCNLQRSQQRRWKEASWNERKDVSK